MILDPYTYGSHFLLLSWPLLSHFNSQFLMILQRRVIAQREDLWGLDWNLVERFEEDFMNPIVQVVLGVRLTRIATAATYALLLFEFLIIFNQEYETVYKSRWSLSKCLYLGCRFCPLLLWPVVMYAFLLDHDEKLCESLVKVVSVIFLILPSLPQCVYIIRAWAFTGANRQSLFIYIPCLLGYVFILSWFSLHEMVTFTQSFVVLGKTGCFKGFPHGYNSYSRTVFGAIALDVVVGTMVLIHCIKMQTHYSRLGKLLTVQGLFYFPLMFLLNAFAGAVSTTGTFRGYDGMVFCVVIAISNILACRFIIQIREYAVPDSDTLQLMSMVQRQLDRTTT